MSKRGIGGEVDWIVAIGLFLVFMGVVLTLFRPGIQPVFDHAALQTIVEENFLKDTSWEIYKQAIFVEPIAYACTQGGTTETCRTEDARDALFRLNGQVHLKDAAGGYAAQGSEAFPAFSRELFNGMDDTTIEKHVRVYSITEPEAPGQLTSLSILDITGRQTGSDEKECSEDKDCRYGLKECDKEIGRCKECQTTRIPIVGCDDGEYCLDNKCVETKSAEVEKAKERASGAERGSRKDAHGIASADSDLQHQNEQIKTKFKDATQQVDQAVGTRRQKLYGTDIKFKVQDKKLFFRPAITAKKRYLLLYSDEIISHDAGGETDTTNSLTACIIPDLGSATFPTNACQAQYAPGVAEKLEGISVRKFALLGTKDKNDTPCPAGMEYACAKERWGYPAVKDFRVDIFDLYGKNLHLTFNPVEIPAQATVRVKQYNTFLLTEEGLRIPVTISIKVW